MRFEFLSPELFNNLILANLALGILLVIGRFTLDMRRKKPVRQQSYSELSNSYLEDTNPSLGQLDTEKQNTRSKTND